MVEKGPLTRWAQTPPESALAVRWLDRNVVLSPDSLPCAGSPRGRQKLQQGESYPLKSLLQAARTRRRSDWPSKDKNNTENPHLLLVLGLLGLLSSWLHFQMLHFLELFKPRPARLEVQGKWTPPPPSQLLSPPTLPPKGKQDNTRLFSSGFHLLRSCEKNFEV